jgi:hypothetical protein
MINPKKTGIVWREIVCRRYERGVILMSSSITAELITSRMLSKRVKRNATLHSSHPLKG